jgi:hypothetical protein
LPSRSGTATPCSCAVLVVASAAIVDHTWSVDSTSHANLAGRLAPRQRPSRWSEAAVLICPDLLGSHFGCSRGWEGRLGPAASVETRGSVRRRQRRRFDVAGSVAKPIVWTGGKVTVGVVGRKGCFRAFRKASRPLGGASKGMPSGVPKGESSAHVADARERRPSRQIVAHNVFEPSTGSGLRPRPVW